MRTRHGQRSAPARVRLVNRALDSSFDLSLSALSSSSVGFAVLDRRLRFCSINPALAAFNNLPPVAHLGKPLHSIIGDLERVVGPRIESVFINKMPVVGIEVSGELPKRDDVGFWIADYLPVFDRRGRIAQVCAVVVEVTRQRRLEQEVSNLRNNTLRQFMALAGRTQRTLQQCVKWVNSNSAFQVDVDRSVEAFHELHRGFQEIVAKLVATLPASNEPQTGSRIAAALPMRQKEIIQLLTKEESLKDIAELLNLSSKTVENHKARIFRKLGFDSLADLTRYAIRTGLVEL